MKYLTSVLFFWFLFSISAQNQKSKLIVGIVVDQMRYDYLYKFQNHYSEKGFKRLLNNGFNAKNTHYSYIPTYTGPGHASIFTGTTPAYHGIISNNWYDKQENKIIYCVDDENMTSVGIVGEAGQRSPKQLLTTTIGDQNRLHTQFDGKTISISLEDRSSILSGGHTANASYWLAGENEGKFVSSSFYMDKLPDWVKGFNKDTDRYLKTWNTLEPIELYKESGSDLNNYEKTFVGKSTATFPYDLKALAKNNKGFSILKDTPMGDEMLTDFAIEAITNEELGKDEATDFLIIGYTSPDYVGHNFGVNSKEIQDTYIRLDLQISALLNHLDKSVGKDNYTLFLTADHGAVHVPQFLKDQKIPAGYFDNKQLRRSVKQFVENRFGSAMLIEGYSDNVIFFDYDELENNNIEADDMQEALYYFILKQDGVDRVYTRDMIEQNDMTDNFGMALKNGFHPKRSGDVFFILEPSIIPYIEKGSTHGSYYPYDSHVPLIFYGAHIKKGVTYKKYNVRDIAPTLSALLDIEQPNGTTGVIIEEIFDKN